MSKRKRMLAVLPAALLLFTVVSVAFATDGVVVPGNVTCQDLGYEYGYKIDPVHVGEYWIPGMGEAGVIWIHWTDGLYFKWQTRFGTDAVIVKGGEDSNVYYLDEAHWGQGYHAPSTPTMASLRPESRHLLLGSASTVRAALSLSVTSGPDSAN